MVPAGGGASVRLCEQLCVRLQAWCCQQRCGRLLACQQHTCTEACHSGKPRPPHSFSALVGRSRSSVCVRVRPLSQSEPAELRVRPPEGGAAVRQPPLDLRAGESGLWFLWKPWRISNQVSINRSRQNKT